MIYVCIPSFNEGPTIGLVLWKIRKVFQEFPREYQFLVVDDGSTDGNRGNPGALHQGASTDRLRHSVRQGYARSVEELLQPGPRADRPTQARQRDRSCTPILRTGREFLPEFVRRLDSGADMVVGEATLSGEPSPRSPAGPPVGPDAAPPCGQGAGVTDTVSGFVAFRLMTLKNALRQPGAAGSPPRDGPPMPS